MKHKITILLLFCTILFMDCNTCNTSIAATVDEDTSTKTMQTLSTSNNDETISPCSDVIEWKYIIISGKTYRRQYNSTTHEWLGVWELVP